MSGYCAFFPKFRDCTKSNAADSVIRSHFPVRNRWTYPTKRFIVVMMIVFSVMKIDSIMWTIFSGITNIVGCAHNFYLYCYIFHKINNSIFVSFHQFERKYPIQCFFFFFLALRVYPHVCFFRYSLPFLYNFTLTIYAFFKWYNSLVT